MNFIKILAVVAMALLPAKGHAQIVEAALGALSDKVFDSINDSVNNLFGRFDSTVVGMRSNAEGLLASATSDMSDFLDKSVDELEGQERAIWLYYSNALQKLDRRVEDYARTARITVLDATNAITVAVPFSATDPVIHWIEVSPPLFDHKAERRRVTAFGVNLERDGNALIANEVDARRVTTSPTELTFEVDGIDVEQGLKLTYHLNGKRTFLHLLGSWTDRSVDPKYFEVPAEADFVGMARLIYLQDEYPVITRQWPSNGKMHSVNCQRGGALGTSGCTAKYGPTFIGARDGHSILVDSIKSSHDTHGCRKTSTKVEIQDRSSNGFKAFFSGYPNSGAGRRCYISAKYTWQERAKVPNKVERETAEAELRRSLKGITFRYPTAGATPIGISVLHDGDEEPQIYDLASIRADMTVNAQPGTGIVEVIWSVDPS